MSNKDDYNIKLESLNHQGVSEINSELNKIPDNILIPKKEKSSLLYAIGIAIAIYLVAIFLSSLSNVVYEVRFFIDLYIVGSVRNALYNMFGLPGIFSDIILGVVSIAFAVVIYMWIKKPREITKQIKRVTNIQERETSEYFDLAYLDAGLLMDQLIKRGCEIIDVDEYKFAIGCKEIPISEKMRHIIEGPPESWLKKEKLIKFIILNLILIIFILGLNFMRIGEVMDDTIGVIPIEASYTISDVIFLAIFFFCMSLLVEMEVLSLTQTVLILVPIYTGIIFLFVEMNIIVKYIFLSLVIACIIFILTMHLLRAYTCYESNSWWCEML